MSGSKTDTTLPYPNSQLVDPTTGVVSHVWWYFFQRLYIRTGGGTPPPNPDSLQEQISALFVEEAFSGDAQPSPNVGLALADVMGGEAPVPLSIGFSMTDVMGGNQEPDNSANSLMLSLAFAGEPNEEAIDPILAALIVSDVYP